MFISPSLLAADFSNLRQELDRVQTADALHIDIMDGHFVPNLSIGPGLMQSIRPYTELPFDVHLMVTHPLAYIDPFVDAGAQYLSFHPEAEDDPGTVIRAIQARGALPGLALKPDTAPEVVFPYADDLHFVLILSVEPGFGGQTLMPQTLEKAKALRAHCPQLLLELDGGVNRETRVLCGDMDILVAGTGIFRAEHPAEEIAFLRGKH